MLFPALGTALGLFQQKDPVRVPLEYARHFWATTPGPAPGILGLQRRERGSGEAGPEGNKAPLPLPGFSTEKPGREGPQYQERDRSWFSLLLSLAPVILT